MSSIGSVLFEARGLTVEVTTGSRSWRRVLDDVSFEVRAGETLALMGESGVGKTLTALALVGLLPKGARLVSGQALFRGQDLLTRTAEELRRVRGREIGMVFQDPMTSMNPTMRIDEQLAEALLAHDTAMTGAAARETMTRRLELFGVPSSRLAHAAYPWEWSGGMRQRALIAMATANRPALLIADEPTTALDAMTQSQVLESLRAVQRETGSSILLITHDAAVISEMADRVVVLRAGAVVEAGSAEEVLLSPRHSYTAALVAAEPAPFESASSSWGSDRAQAAAPQAVLRVERLSVSYRLRPPHRETVLRAVEKVSFEVADAETLAIVGESGSGKSTLARSLVGLEPSAQGKVLVDGVNLLDAGAPTLKTLRKKIQIVFQDPYSSLNPRRLVSDTITEPLRIHGQFEPHGHATRIADLLRRVGLSPEHGSRFPHQLSGGERQRVALARALVIEPRIVVLDEPVSSLDGPTRGGILRLLAELQEERGVAFILISHDLRVVRGLAHRVAVMSLGRFVEVAGASRLFERPEHPYTRSLLSAMAVGDPARRSPRERARRIVKDTPVP